MVSTSATLLARMRDPSDHSAWERFTQLYTPLLVYWSRKAGLTEPDLCDLVQEVYALLLKKLPEFEYDGQGTFRGWLRTVTLNKWREMNRKRHPTPVGPDDERLNNLPEQASVAFWETEYQEFLV